MQDNDDMLLSSFTQESQEILDIKTPENGPKQFFDNHSTNKKQDTNQYIINQLTSRNQALEIQLMLQKKQNSLLKLDYEKKLAQVKKDAEQYLKLEKISQKEKIKILEMELEKRTEQIFSLVEVINQLKCSSKRTSNYTNYNTETKVHSPRNNQSAHQNLFVFYEKEIEKLKEETNNFENRFQREKLNLNQEIQHMARQKSALENILKMKTERSLTDRKHRKNQTQTQTQLFY